MSPSSRSATVDHPRLIHINMIHPTPYKFHSATPFWSPIFMYRMLSKPPTQTFNFAYFITKDTLQLSIIPHLTFTNFCLANWLFRANFLYIIWVYRPQNATMTLWHTTIKRTLGPGTANDKQILICMLSTTPSEKEYLLLNPLTPELNPSAQRCLTRFLNWGFCFLNRAFR
jgi:hypothetical protein